MATFNKATLGSHFKPRECAIHDATLRIQHTRCSRRLCLAIVHIYDAIHQTGRK